MAAAPFIRMPVNLWSNVKPTPEGDRGQLMLLAAVVLALVFVALGVLLNSAAFTGAEAAREGASDAEDALADREDAIDGVGGALFYANYYNYSDGIEDALRTDVRNWNESFAAAAAAHRTIGDVALRSTTPGTQIYQYQNDTRRNFTDADGSESWTLAENVTGVRRFAMNASVQSNTLSLGANVSELLGDDAFYVEANRTGSGQARLFVYGNADGNVTVARSENGTVIDSWGADDGDALVEPTAGRIDGAERANLSFPGLSASFDLRYHNAAGVEGQYGLVVDNASVATDPYSSTESEGPHQVPAAYSALVEITHRTATLDYVTTATVAPETAPNGTVYGVA